MIADALRMAQATPVQSGADELSKVWMADVWDQIVLPMYRAGKTSEYCEPWCRVHDDLILETEEGSANRIAKHMLSLVPQRLICRTEAEAKTGTDWGSLT